ncbi:hypothetical protein FRC03_011083 [Tulasnella sp. 419]|nr:hypothetical protein FRC03_011083 [Tulasnella sp. 419]
MVEASTSADNVPLKRVRRRSSTIDDTIKRMRRDFLRNGIITSQDERAPLLQPHSPQVGLSSAQFTPSRSQLIHVFPPRLTSHEGTVFLQTPAPFNGLQQPQSGIAHISAPRNLKHAPPLLAHGTLGKIPSQDGIPKHNIVTYSPVIQLQENRPHFSRSRAPSPVSNVNSTLLDASHHSPRFYHHGSIQTTSELQQEEVGQVVPTPFSSKFSVLEEYIGDCFRLWRNSKDLDHPQNPIIAGMTVSLIKLFWVVGAFGGRRKVNWETIYDILIPTNPPLLGLVDDTLSGAIKVHEIEKPHRLQLLEFEEYWYKTLRLDDPTELFPLPPHLQHFHPQIKLAVGLPADPPAGVTIPDPANVVATRSVLQESQSSTRVSSEETLISAYFGAPNLTGCWTKVDDIPLVTGGNSDIYRAHLEKGLASEEKQLIAVKLLRSIRIRPNCAPEDILKKRLMREMRVWTQLQHDNIVPFLGYAFSGNFPCMIAPWYENGSIPDYIAKNPAVDRTQMVLESMNGLAHLHSRVPPIVHGDLKATNVLVDDKGTARITDFGLSRILEEGHSGFTTSTGVTGTHRWMAPELMLTERSRPTTEADIYSMTLLALEIYTGKVPFAHLDQMPFLMAIVAKSSPERSHYRPFNPPEDVWRVFESGWSFEPSQRPNAENLKKEFEIALSSTSWR